MSDPGADCEHDDELKTSDGRSMFNRLKKPAQRATWSRFKAQAEYLDEVDELGDTARWLEGVAPAKVTDFAGEAAAQDVDTLSRYGDAKKLALVACLAHTARMRARDDLAEMLCKRVASILKKAKAELEEIRLRQRAVSERLIGTYRTVLEHLDPDGEAAAQEPGQGRPARWPRSRRPAGSLPSCRTSRRCRPTTATTTRCWCSGSSAWTAR